MRFPVNFARVPLNFRLIPIVAVFVLTACGRQERQVVKKEAVNPHSVSLSWQPSKSKSAIAGYNVYRILPPGGPVKLSPRPVTDTQFTDRTAEAGSSYLYFVTTVDSKGAESAPSQKLSVSVPTDLPPPAKQ